MLSVLTFGLLACAVVLGIVSSFENTLSLLAYLLGGFILFPVTLILVLLSVGLPAFSAVLPVGGGWGAILGAYVDGAYGFPGWSYMVGSAILWFIPPLQLADEDTETDETSATVEDTTETDGTDSNDSETQNLTDLGGLGEATAEELSEAGFESVEHISAADQAQLQSVEGVSNALAARIKAETDGVDVSDEVDADVEKIGDKEEPDEDEDADEETIEGLTEISGVGDKQADTLKKAGYSTLDDVTRASQSELADVVGNALGARIKADVGSLEVGPGSSETGAAVDASGGSETDSEISDSETGPRAVGEESGKSGNESKATSGGKKREEKEYETLTTISGVRSDKAKELYEAGYESIDDIRNARRTELATVVGNALAARIKTHVGHSRDKHNESISTKAEDTKKSSTKDTDGVNSGDSEGEDLSETDAIGVGGNDLTEVDGLGNVATEGGKSGGSDNKSESGDKEKPESENDGGASASETTDTEKFDRQLAAEKKAVRSHVEDATSAPFRDIESTRKQLIRCHKMAAELAESAKETERVGIFNSAERILGEIETLLEALSEAADSLKSARSHVPPDEGPSDSMSISELEAAHESYSSAINIADEAGFDTERLANERADIRSTLENLEEQAAREEMLETLQSLHSRLNRAPKASELPEDTEYSQYDYRDEFGSWDKALKAAGIDKEQEMLDAVERVAKKVGHVPNSADMNEHGTYSYTYYLSYFDSWSTALKKSGVKGNFNEKREEMLEILQSLQDSLGRVPKAAEISEDCEYSPNDFYNEFGSWDEALEAADIDKPQHPNSDQEADSPVSSRREKLIVELQKLDEDWNIIDEKLLNSVSDYSLADFQDVFGSLDTAIDEAGLSGRHSEASESQQNESSAPDRLGRDTGVDAGETEPTRADYIETIKEYANSTDKVVKSTDVSEQNEYSVNDMIQEFGSWQDALSTAGVDNEQRLLQELRRVADKLGHKPTTTEMNKHGQVSATMYSSYFESYTAAREIAFSDDEDNFSEESENNDASFATISSITEDGRFESPIALRCVRNSTNRDGKKQAVLKVEDVSGTYCRLNIWRKHDINTSWKEDHWYILEGARKKVWTNSMGNETRRVSSTKDLKIRHVGTDRPTSLNEGSAVDVRESGSEETSKGTRGTADDDPEDGESDGILEEVLNEFEEMDDI